VDLEDALSGRLVWQRKLDLAVQTSGTEQSRVEDIDSVGRGDDLEKSTRI
jgi:hypothetical protein